MRKDAETGKGKVDPGATSLAGMEEIYMKGGEKRRLRKRFPGGIHGTFTGASRGKDDFRHNWEHTSRFLPTEGWGIPCCQGKGKNQHPGSSNNNGIYFRASFRG